MNSAVNSSRTRRLIAGAVIVGLAVAGCSSPEGASPSPSMTSAPTAQSPATPSPASPTPPSSPTSAPDASALFDAVRNLTYRGAALEVQNKADTESYLGVIRDNLDTPGLTFEPARCADLNRELNAKLVAADNDIAVARAMVDEQQIVLQVSRGTAASIDFGAVSDLVRQCSQFVVSAHGQSIESRVTLLPLSVAADSAYGQHATQEIPAGTIHVYSVLAKVGPNLIAAILTTPNEADIGDVEELVNTVAGRL